MNEKWTIQKEISEIIESIDFHIFSLPYLYGA